jgi:hypothetical protein
MADEARLATALADRYRLDRELGHGGMDTDGKTLYFTINEWESDVWVTDLREE